MGKFSIQPSQWFGAPLRRVVFLATVTLAPLASAVQSHAAATDQGAFVGTWSVQRCDKTRRTVDCGSFTVYLLQQGDRVCGSHDATSPGLARLDEGQDRSVLGAVLGSTAVLTIESGRSEAVSLVTVKRQRESLHWVRRETVTEGNGDSDEIANKAVLRRMKPASVPEAKLDAVRAACKTHWGTAP